MGMHILMLVISGTLVIVDLPGLHRQLLHVLKVLLLILLIIFRLTTFIIGKALPSVALVPIQWGRGEATISSKDHRLSKLE